MHAVYYANALFKRFAYKILVPMHLLHLDIDRLFLGIDPNYDPVPATNSACAANHIVQLPVSRFRGPCARDTYVHKFICVDDSSVRF